MLAAVEDGRLIGALTYELRDGELEVVTLDAFEQGWNAGLAGLCDLANDLDQDTALSRLLELRHAATHRLVVAHELATPDSAPDWLTRIAYDELVERSLEQLRLVRGALMYLLRAIDVAERLRARRDGHPDGRPPGQLRLRAVDPDSTEQD